MRCQIRFVVNGIDCVTQTFPSKRSAIEHAYECIHEVASDWWVEAEELPMSWVRIYPLVK